MRWILVLTTATYNLIIFLFVLFLAHLAIIFLNLDSPSEKILAHLAFFPLFINRRLFRNSHNSCGKFRESSTGKIMAYLLNMDRATDRLNRVMPQISNLGLPLERISAIDGNLLSEEKIQSITDIKSYKRYFRMLPEVGTIGCSLSHEKAWRRFLESDNEFAVIFEDDAHFDPEELSETVKSVIKKKELWDIVGFELNHHGHPLEIAGLSSGKSLVVYLTNVKHSGCYLISRRTAHKLLEKFYPLKMPLDHYFTAAWEFDIRFCGVEPRVVKQNLGNSQIKVSGAEKMRSPDIVTLNAIYKVKRAIMHTIYNFYCFLLT